MKKTQPTLSSRKPRRTPRKNEKAAPVFPANLPHGTQQALMGLAAFQARHS